MEIPDELQGLYRHWSKHTVKPEPHTDPLTVDTGIHRGMAAFATERMRIYEQKIAGQAPPYSTDPLLIQFRFCNVYRELDRQTIAIHSLLKDLRDVFPLWLLNLAYCRMVCSPETVKKTGLLSFSKKHNLMVKGKLLKLSSPKYGSAYIFPISLLRNKAYPTREDFFSGYLPLAIPAVARKIASFRDLSVVDALKLVIPAFGYNFKFHWTEILIDVAYQFPEKINLFKRFPIGPGSAPTMKLLNPQADPELVNLSLCSWQPKGFPYLTYQGKPVYLSAENWEGIGCEFRKYSNLKQGRGRHRLYKTA